MEVSVITNYLSKFAATNTIGISQLFDNRNNFGMNTSSLAGKLHTKDRNRLINDLMKRVELLENE